MHLRKSNTQKVSSEFYVPSYTVADSHTNYDLKNVLLCQFNMIDVAIYILKNSTSRILLHNFANNIKPCDGLWDSNSQENQLYNCSNLKDLVLPIQHNLYPIQLDIDKKDSYGNYTVNMLITEGCQLYKTSAGKSIDEPVYVDIASLCAIMAPSERNLDFYVNMDQDECTRYDYALDTDRKKMEHKIRFMLKYAIGEKYDCLITGAWDFGNPHWGLINIWNSVIESLPNLDLKIIFCIPIGLDGESELSYKYFCKYLVGQTYQQIDFDKLRNEKQIKKKLQEISKDEQHIKSRIYGLVWGVALSEVNNAYIQQYKSENEALNINTEHTDVAHTIESPWILTNSDYSLDWNICTDMTVLIMRTMTESTPLLDINPKILAHKLLEWKNVGFKELDNRLNTCNDGIIKHVISQSNYEHAPFETAENVYKSKGREDTSNNSLCRNMLNGIFKDYVRRSILSCKLIQPDEACQVSCLVHSFIIRSIWEGNYITTEDWSKISNLCYKIFDTNRSINIQRKIDFNSYWMIARNYQYKINDGIKAFITQNLGMLDPKTHMNNHTYIPMAIAIIIAFDIQSYIKVDGRKVRDMMNTIEISVADEKLRHQKIDYTKELPENYYFQCMQDLAEVISNNATNATAGSILGLACFNNVYNDLALKDDNGNSIESNSQQWIKYATFKDWLNIEIEKFASAYLDVRRKIIINNNKLNSNIYQN